MGMPVSERRILEKIHQAIQVSDPHLTSLFSIFGRLSRDEHMPAREPLRTHTWLLLAALRRWPSARRWMVARRRRAARRRLRSGPPPRRTAWLFYSLAALALVAAIIITAHSSGATCAGAAPPGAARHHAQNKTCAPGVKSPWLGER
jgi:hypothetical protein